jgi:Mg-chelatase subunit ChlD/tetratricopeptide (TPR) repeat protein
LVLLAILAVLSACQREAGTVRGTVGELAMIHSKVLLQGKEVRGVHRLAVGERITTEPEGRARARLDDGTLAIIDGGTSLSLERDMLRLEAGRIFVERQDPKPITVGMGTSRIALSGSAASLELHGATGSVYCSRGEISIAHGGRAYRVASGETAKLAGEAVTVSPEKAFEDWTSGYAAPWHSASGEKSAIPEARAGAALTVLGVPFVVRSHGVNVSIDGELALTRSVTTFFNGASSAERANVRLALPAGAIVTRVAKRGGASANETDARLVIAAGPSRTGSSAHSGLEWAGAGFVQGDIGTVGSGEAVELILEYSEWLGTQGDRSTYRYPMTSRHDTAPIGELTIEIDTTKSGRATVSHNAEASSSEARIRYRASDARPTSDFVVELAALTADPPALRAYVESGGTGEDPYVMVRAELPEKAPSPLALVLVLDASMSMGGSGFELGRSTVAAILSKLGIHDEVAVVVAEQKVKTVGSSVLEPLSAERRIELMRSLSALRPGGASNLGLALEHAAALIDANSRGARAKHGTVVYIGDGRPTLGAASAAEIRRLLARRAGGLPRLSTVAIGPHADRWFLAGLAAGTGLSRDVTDPADSARAASDLVAHDLEPAFRNVTLDLGPTVDRLYPREPGMVRAGSTHTVVGRLRGRLPARAALRYVDGEKTVTEWRPLARAPLPGRAGLPARWAAARVEELSLGDQGIEPAIALAARAELLTPWTSWLFSEPSPGFASMGLAQRVLELSPERDVAFARRIESIVPSGSMLLEPPSRLPVGTTLLEAAEAAVKRTLDKSASAVRACRDARAAARSHLPDSIAITVSVSGEGRPTRVGVDMAPARRRFSDRLLEQCIENVVRSLPFIAAGVVVSTRHALTVPVTEDQDPVRCSPESRVSLPVRKLVWRDRTADAATVYVEAGRRCELPAWKDRRALLGVLLERLADGPSRLELAQSLDRRGERDAADFVRSEALRRATSHAEFEALRRILLVSEPDVADELEKAYGKAQTDQERLASVRRFLELAPNNPFARRRLLALLEALDHRPALLEEIEGLRADPFADAGLLSLAASALRRAGYEEEATRAFGELCERAPEDPWTLAFVGDRLRAEALDDEATAIYERLAELLPNDAGVDLRAALAHAGSGRLDLAVRLLERVAATGGRGNDAGLGELAAITAAVLIAGAQANDQRPSVREELARKALELALPDAAAFVLVRSPPSDQPVTLSMVRSTLKQPQSADLDASVLGLSALRIERGERDVEIVLSRPAEAGPGRAIPAEVSVLTRSPSSDQKPLALLTQTVLVTADGTPVRLHFDGNTLRR